MSKSKIDQIKDKFQKVIDKCAEAGNKKAVKVYEKIRDQKIKEYEAQKKSQEQDPEKSAEQVKAEKEKAEERIKDLKADMESVNNDIEILIGIVGDLLGDLILINALNENVVEEAEGEKA